MGQFTRRLSRSTGQPTATFTIPDELLSMDWSRGARMQRFTLRKLFGDEVEESDQMILRSVAKVGGRKLGSLALQDWWRDIGPRARRGVRLCFYAVHNPD